MPTQNSTNNSTDANRNLIIGKDAGNTSISGPDNCLIGYLAGTSLTTGTQNCFVGNLSGNLATDMDGNCCLGYQAGKSLVSGADQNTLIGARAGEVLATGAGNTGVGVEVFFNGVSGGLTSGSLNTVIGYKSGLNYTSSESGNILIGYQQGVVGESNVTRIGNNNIPGTQLACFIDGIGGVSVSNGQMVTVNPATAQLGSQPIPSGLQTWSVIIADQSAVAGSGYFCNKAGSVCLVQLPATSVVGDTFTVVAMNAQGWRVTQGTGQQIFFGNGSTTSGATGYLAFANIGDTATLVCRVANTEWQVIDNIGSITPN